MNELWIAVPFFVLHLVVRVSESMRKTKGVPEEETELWSDARGITWGLAFVSAVFALVLMMKK